jgi:alpha-glucosidase
VQDAVLDAVRFWLDRGVDGFRLDTINFYFHSKGLESNPPLPDELRNSSIAPAVNPYNFQEHLYDKNQPENLDFLRRFRALLDEYPAAAAVGEVGDAQRGLEIVAQYTSGGDKVHMCYAFDFLSPDPLTPARVREVVSTFEGGAPDGWACWAFSNHDVMRHATRWAENPSDRLAVLKATTSLILTLKGSACLYQGEELGLTEAELAFEDLQDPYGIQFWPKFKGRDGCRTPMVWEDRPGGGFTTGKPWLPVPAEHLKQAVSTQENAQGSLLEHYRAMLAFRAQHPLFAKGEIEFADAGDAVLAFTRTLGNECIGVWINLSGEPQSIPMAHRNLERLDAPGASGALEDNTLRLPAWGMFMARITG